MTEAGQRIGFSRHQIGLHSSYAGRPRRGLRVVPEPSVLFKATFAAFQTDRILVRSRRGLLFNLEILLICR